MENSAKGNGPLDHFRKVSQGFGLFKEGKSPVLMPETFLRADKKLFARRPELLKSLISCYRDVFGRSDVWGEGGVCAGCGKIFSADESEGGECPECGGILKEYYPQRELEKRILKETGSRTSFCSLMLSPKEGEKVAGFCWGAVLSLRAARKRLSGSEYVGGLADETARLLGKAGTGRKILFIDEIGVMKEYGGRMDSLIFLARSGFERGAARGAKEAIFWTNKESPIYKICRGFGFMDLIEGEDGIVVLYLEDFIPALKVMQNKQPGGAARILVQGARLI